MLTSALRVELERIVGQDHVIDDPAALQRYGTDAMNRGTAADLVVLPGSTGEVSQVARACYAAKVPFVPRGGGTGYSGGAVPLRGGVVISLERLNRIIEIDEENLLAVVEPSVVTGDLQAAVERVGLFYPPDPASLRQSVIGGNVAECAGGPRAFKYGTTKRYVLGLEAVLPTGEVIETGSKAVKNVVGYDLTQLLVGSEGTLAIITRVILRLLPRPPAVATLRATFADIDGAVAAVTELLRARVIPATLEIIDAECLESVARYTGAEMAPAGTGAMLLVEVDGLEQAVSEEIIRVDAAVRTAGAREVLRASNEAERQELWRVRRELSPSLKLIAPVKFNHDVVVPRGRVPQLFDLVARLRRESRLKIPCFGHAGDGNIHVNIMVDPGEEGAMDRAQEAQVSLFRGVVALEGSISGEHGIGFAKAPYIALELSPVEIDLMQRVKRVFDPEGLLNPGKIFPG
ncbi:MAG: FAD-binding protein [Acidobacteria bacterium]|nr:FAD-binding protein [Acidobacteriota bacterium]